MQLNKKTFSQVTNGRNQSLNNDSKTAKTAKITTLVTSPD